MFGTTFINICPRNSPWETPKITFSLECINRTWKITDAKSPARHQACQVQAGYEAKWRTLGRLTQQTNRGCVIYQLDTAHAKCNGGCTKPRAEVIQEYRIHMYYFDNSMLYVGILLRYKTKARPTWTRVGLWKPIEGIRVSPPDLRGGTFVNFGPGGGRLPTNG